MAKEIDETLEFPFGSGGQSGMAGSATRMRRIRTRDVRKSRDETDGVRSDWVHRRAVRAALAAGHEAAAVARRPEALAPADPSLRVLAGDVLDPASPRDGVAGYDIEPGLNKQEPYVV